MRIRISWIGFALLNCALLQGAEVKLGVQAPELDAKDCRGTAVRLAEYRQKRVAILLAQAQGGLLTAQVRADACRQTEPLNVVVLFLQGNTDQDRRLLDPAQSGTVLIDSGGVVRRILAAVPCTGLSPDLLHKRNPLGLPPRRASEPHPRFGVTAHPP
jgi:hypothetical protein